MSRLASGAFLLLLGACTMVSAQAGWRVWDFGEFQLRAPSGLTQVAGGSDSLAGALSADGLRIDYDFGLYSDPLKPRSDIRSFESRAGTVDGLPARFVRFTRVGPAGGRQSCDGVHVPLVRKSDMGALAFTALACAFDASRLKDIPAVFSSLRFSATKPG